MRSPELCATSPWKVPLSEQFQPQYISLIAGNIADIYRNVCHCLSVSEHRTQCVETTEVESSLLLKSWVVCSIPVTVERAVTHIGGVSHVTHTVTELRGTAIEFVSAMLKRPS